MIDIAKEGGVSSDGPVEAAVETAGDIVGNAFE